MKGWGEVNGRDEVNGWGEVKGRGE